MWLASPERLGYLGRVRDVQKHKAQTGLLGGQQAETQTSENPQREEE